MMNRREFLATGAFAGLAALSPSSASPRATGNPRFALNYAPHFGMFRHHAGDDLLEQIGFIADQGFAALEDNALRTRPAAVQTQIGRSLEQRGMTMGAFVGLADFGEPTFASGRADLRDRVLRDVRSSVETAKRVGARAFVVVPGKAAHRLPAIKQTSNAVDLLQRCAAICERAGVTMLLEPLNHWRGRPMLWLSSLAQARSVCRQVNRPSCKILLDVYHQHVTGRDVLREIDRSGSELGYIQFGDNPGRKEPGTGSIDYLSIVRMLHGRGYGGVIGLEHGNSRPGREGELAVIEAYAKLEAIR